MNVRTAPLQTRTWMECVEREGMKKRERKRRLEKGGRQPYLGYPFAPGLGLEGGRERGTRRDSIWGLRGVTEQNRKVRRREGEPHTQDTSISISLTWKKLEISPLLL